VHRKVVTVLFCDVVGSTALGESVDPEALQGLLARYFDRMKAIVESHGGTVEKFIGDAGRIGVDTGEVVTGTEERLATGDAVNVAAAIRKFDEAGQWVERSRAATDEADMESQIAWRKPEALLLAHADDRAAAEALAREAVRLADGTDDPTSQSDARVLLADILCLDDRMDEAVTALDEAIELYEAKGNVLGAAHARTRLDAVPEEVPS
jgi:hypothetical protein